MPSTVHMNLFLYRQELNTFLLKVSNSLLDKSNCISTNYVMSTISTCVCQGSVWMDADLRSSESCSVSWECSSRLMDQPSWSRATQKCWLPSMDPMKCVDMTFFTSLIPKSPQLSITCSSVNNGKLGGVWERGYFFALVSGQKLNTSL